MAQDKKHLNFDLEFLDKKESVKGEKNKPRLDKPNKSNVIFNAFKHNWKKILIVGGVGLFFVWLVSSDDGSSKTNTGSINYNPPAINQTINYANSEDNTVIVGQYRCLIHHANKADELNPSNLVGQQIDSEQQRLDNLTTQIQNLADEIQWTYIDEYSQYSVNKYNDLVDNYNTMLEMYQRDADALDIKINQYNIKVDKYNNYLETNCTKIK